jgi:hypothetical protein
MRLSSRKRKQLLIRRLLTWRLASRLWCRWPLKRRGLRRLSRRRPRKILLLSVSLAQAALSLLAQ